MLPFLHIFDLTIPLYGLCIAIGVIFGTLVTVLNGKRRNLPRQDVLFALCFGGVGAFIGAKLLYLLTIVPDLVKSFDRFIANPSLLLVLFTGGFVFYGAVLGGLAGVVIYARKFRLNTPDLLDALAPGIPLAHALGRVGCFCAGCCYGIPMDPPLGVLFDASPFAPHSVYLFPVQLLESSLNILLCAALLLFFCRSKTRGNTILLYLFLYSLERFALEYFRADAARGAFLWFSTSQWISIALALGCVVFAALRARRKKRPHKEPPSAG